MDSTRTTRGSTDTQMFGCTESQVLSMIENNLYAKLLGKDAGDLMLAMSILSDAQEVMAMGSVEQARQFINKSKYILSECMDRLSERNK